ncbi:hypothetical protein Q6O01_004594 [Salmonella enterica]|nr:hypothetical protein [Salmonella enterica]
MMNRTEQARIAIQSRKEAEKQISQTVEVEEAVSVAESDSAFIGYVWKNGRDSLRKEKIIFKHTIPLPDSIVIIEEGLNSFSIYGNENYTCDIVSNFLDYFGSRLKKWGCFKPESYNDEFNYFFFKECILRNLPVAISIYNNDMDKQKEIIRDVLKDIEQEYTKASVNNFTKTYIDSYVYNWKRNLKAIA